MPELSASVALHRRGLEAIETAARGWGAAALNVPQLASYQSRGTVVGWRLKVEFSDGVHRRLDILVDKAFPRSAPQVALVDRPEFLEWPHVEKDGILCLLNSASEVSPFAPLQAVEHQLGEACALVEDLLAGRLDDEFRAEFLSYWDWSTTNGAIPVRSLLEPAGPSRVVRVWRGTDQYLVAETDEQLENWLKSVRGVTKVRQEEFDPALLIWRSAPLNPSEYPRTGSGLAKLTEGEATDVLGAMAAQQPARLVTLVGFPTENGVAFAGVTLRAPVQERRGGPRPVQIDAGFRPGKTPPALVARRYFGGAQVMRSSVDRVDPSWVHGRDQDARQLALGSARVTILGCGSIGGPLAILLAQAGVGFIRLVDPQRLVAANIGRHPLGARYLGRQKAPSLAAEIKGRLPHVEVEAHSCHWEELPADLKIFEDSDLVISAMGSWTAEGALNAQHLGNQRICPVLYGWTEAHAMAGHAVLVGRSSGCLQCGLDALGGAKLPVTEWPEGKGLRQEPACGAVFQPYGPIELNHVVSAIAELSLDAVLGVERGGAHRIWTAAERRLRTAGGDWSPAWRASGRQAPSGGGIHELTWDATIDCPECGAKAAA